MKNYVRTCVAMMAAAALMGLSACGSDSSGGGGGTTNNGDFSVSGKLGSVSIMADIKRGGVSVRTVKTISHVMAMSPATGNPERYIATVGTDGSFTLEVTSGKPYVMVFIDDSQVGADMIVGIFNPGDMTSGLDTLLPSGAGSANLGNMDVDGTTQVADMSTTFSTFLTSMGINATTAATIGAIDDLSLRAANPDVDSNGVIDYLEGKTFALDFHIRTTTSCTGCSGAAMPYDLIDGAYITDVPGFSIVPSGSSIYAIHDSTFDSTAMTNYFTSGVSTTLSGGAAFAVTDMPGGGTADIDTHSTFSGGTFSSNRQWGPDYDLSAGGIELPGYDHPVKMVWTTGTSKTMTFTHVRTRAKADLFTLLPDLKFNIVGGVVASVDYRWRKWSGSAWAAATAAEVQLILGSDSAHVSLYTTKGGGVEAGVYIKVPASAASGNLLWSSSAIGSTGTLPVPLAQITLDHFCSGTASYDDKLGLRNFSYNFRPASSSMAAYCP